VLPETIGAYSPNAVATPRRARRWALRALEAAAGVLIISGVGVLMLIGNLDGHFVKGRVQRLVKKASGLDVDWRELRLSLHSGIQVSDLVISSPEDERRLAPEFARIGAAEVRWTLNSLMARPHHLDRVFVHGVQVTVVWDEHGHTTLDGLVPSSTSPSQPTPLSRSVVDLLGSWPVSGPVDVDGIAGTLIRTEKGFPVERFELTGLGVHLDSDAGTHGSKLALSIGTESAPLDIDIRRSPTGGPSSAARARMWIIASAQDPDVSGSMDIQIVEQSLAPEMNLRRLLHVDISGHLDPATGHNQIEISHADLADGAAKFEARIDVPDATPASPTIRRATGDVEVGSALAHLSAGLVPFGVSRGDVHWSVDSLRLAPHLGFDDQGSAVAEADLAKAWIKQASGSVTADRVRFSVRASPDPNGANAKVSSSVEDLRLETPEERVAVDRLITEVAAKTVRDVWTGEAAVSADALSASGRQTFFVRDARFVVRAAELDVKAEAPLASRGKVHFSGQVASIRVGGRQRQLWVEDPRLDLETVLSGQTPYEIHGDAKGGIRALSSTGREFTIGPVRLAFQLTDIFPDVAVPLRTRAVLRADFHLADIHGVISADKQATGLEFEASADARNLGALALLRPSGAPWRVPWSQMAATVRSKGQVQNLAAELPEIQQHTELHLDAPGFEIPAAKVSAASLDFSFSSRGTTRRRAADADLRVARCAVGEQRLGDEHLQASMELDAGTPSLRMQIRSDGTGPAAALDAGLSYDRRRHTISYDLTGQLKTLGVLQPLADRLAGGTHLDLSELEVGFSAHGSATGAGSIDARGVPRLSWSPSSLGGSGDGELRLTHVQWEDADQSVEIPALSWQANFKSEGLQHRVDNHLQAERVKFEFGENEIELTGVDDKLDLTLQGDPLSGDAEAKEQLHVGAVRQGFAPGYPIGQLTLSASISRDRGSILRLSDARLVNARGGTSVELRGGLALGEIRRKLSLNAEVKQDLARMWAAPDTCVGSGTVSLGLAVESPDLQVFRTHAEVQIADGHVRLPRAGINAEPIDGDIPVTVNIEKHGNQVRLLAVANASPYSMIRFADQHPLFNSRSFLSVGSLTTPEVSFSPLAGNLAIEQNVFSLSQIEMGVRGGRVTGQCFLEWKGMDSKIRADVRANGVLSSYGEPFDGNAAVVVSLHERSVDGRAEILRIGRRHLQDLLDLQDPHHANAAFNRVRQALALGYPDRVRLTFDHGFADAHIAFGGLAKLVRVDDIRGIPMEPLLDKLLSSLAPTSEEQP
jgi:translocation and assembly module TamB